MKFCPKCKSMMVPKDDKLVCRNCGYEMEKGGEIILKQNRRTEEIAVIDGKEVAVLPITDVMCPECGNNKAYWWLRQLRSADESEVRFFRCTKCGKTWREYT